MSIHNIEKATKILEKGSRTEVCPLSRLATKHINPLSKNFIQCWPYKKPCPNVGPNICHRAHTYRDVSTVVLIARALTHNGLGC